jgi:hypothetical protein
MKMLSSLPVRSRALRGTVAAAVLAVGSFFVAPLTAHASVWDCSTGFSTTGAFAKCLSGNSKNFHVLVQCKNMWGVYTHTAAGPWLPVGSKTPSTTTCNWGESYSSNPWGQGD